MAEFVPKNLCIVGGTGKLGSKITQELLDAKVFNVRLLVRKDTLDKKKDILDTFKAARATIVEGDVHDHLSLVKAFKGSDTVLSVLGSYSPEEVNLIEASKEAGVRRLIPADYGIIIEDREDFVLGPKVKIRDQVIASGLEYTVIFVGGFYQFVFTPRAGFYVDECRVQVPGDGNQTFPVTHISDIPKFIPHILLDPATKNRLVHVFSEIMTYNQAVKTFEEELGNKFEVVYEPFEQVKAFVRDQNIPIGQRICKQLCFLLTTTNHNFDRSFQDGYAGKIKITSIREHARSFQGQ